MADRVRQAHAFFRHRTPDQMLVTAAPWGSPWLPQVTDKTIGKLLFCQEDLTTPVLPPRPSNGTSRLDALQQQSS
jgi:hypothetical protein